MVIADNNKTRKIENCHTALYYKITVVQRLFNNLLTCCKFIKFM